jgi:hypothetical protein
MKREIVYVAHPLGKDVVGNSQRVVRWLDWLCDREPDVSFLCPWLAYVHVHLLRQQTLTPTGHLTELTKEILSDAGHPFRDRAMRDNLRTAEACQGIVLCGGEITPGMWKELAVVRHPHIAGWVSDLTELGPEPPSTMHAAAISVLELGRVHWGMRTEAPSL